MLRTIQSFVGLWPADWWPKDLKTRYTVVLFFALWIVLGLIAWGLVRVGLGYWIELFNGATWPSQFTPSKGYQPDYGFWFYFFLSLRGLLNLGVVLTAVFAVYWFLSGKWLEGLIMNKLNSTYRTSNVLLVERVLQVLGDNKVEVPAKVEELIRAEAKNFGSGEHDSIFRQRIEKAAQAAGTSAH